MKKQIIYPRFIPRLFATSIDLFILSFAITPVMNFISPKIFLLFFKDFLVRNHIDFTNYDAVASAVRTQEFMNYVDIQSYWTYILLLFTINGLLMGVYFIVFWIYKGATPGKMLLGMKIVDADTLEKPKVWQSILRFFSYVTSIIGMWTIVFNKRHQALHDKIAHTVVVKV